MQADHYMFRVASGDQLLEALGLAVADLTTSDSGDTTIDKRDEPAGSLDRPAIVKRFLIKGVAHQRGHVMITRQAINGHAKHCKQFTKMRIRSGAVVLNKVARNDSNIGLPVAVAVVCQYCLERRVRNGTAQRALRVRKQVRIRQVQYTQQA